MPPYRERTAAQKRQSKYARKGTGEGTPVRTTELLADASEVKFVPRIYTTDYSPIMRAAQEAAVHYWGWPADMTFGIFLDTALHMLFKEHGINLAGFSITEEALLQLQQERSRD